VPADCRRPRSPSVLFVGIITREAYVVINLRDYLPVYHIVRFQNRHAHEVKFGADHVVFGIYSDNVGIGIVCIQDRIDECPVALITPGPGNLTLKLNH